MAQFPNAETDIVTLANAMVFKRTGKSIIALTVKDILEEPIAPKRA